MRTSVNFRTRLFESKEPKPHFINPRCFGEDVGAWLMSRLRARRGEPAFTFGELIQEDWGWEFQASAGGVSLRIGVGIMEDSVGADYPQWRIFVERPRHNLIRRLLGRTDSGVHSRLVSAIDEVLYAEPAIAEIQWCDDRDEDCAPHPFDAAE